MFPYFFGEAQVAGKFLSYPDRLMEGTEETVSACTEDLDGITTSKHLASLTLEAMEPIPLFSFLTQVQFRMS
jgi:hypothetical protein